MVRLRSVQVAPHSVVSWIAVPLSRDLSLGVSTAALCDNVKHAARRPPLKRLFRLVISVIELESIWNQDLVVQILGTPTPYHHGED